MEEPVPEAPIILIRYRTTSHGLLEQPPMGQLFLSHPP